MKQFLYTKHKNHKVIQTPRALPTTQTNRVHKKNIQTHLLEKRASSQEV